MLFRDRLRKELQVARQSTVGVLFEGAFSAGARRHDIASSITIFIWTCIAAAVCTVLSHATTWAYLYVYAYPVAHARTRVLREYYVHAYAPSRNRIDRKSGVLALENPVHRGRGTRLWRRPAPRDARTHVRACTFAAWHSNSTKCVYACVVGARNTCNTVPARVYMTFAKCPCTYGETLYIIS